MRSVPQNLLDSFSSSEFSPILLLDMFFFNENEGIYRPFRYTTSDIQISEKINSVGTITAPPPIPQEGCNAQLSSEIDFYNLIPGSSLEITSSIYMVTYKDYHSFQIILDPTPPALSGESFIITTPYSSRGFVIDPISFGISTFQNELKLKIDDVDRILLAALGNIGVDEFPIKLIVATIDDSGEIIGQPDASAKLTIFRGFISNWEYKPGTISLSAQSLAARWNQITLATHSISCRWLVFGGTECKYVIPAGQNLTCDRTYSQCLLYNNTDNFGGFRWLTSIENKELIWGQSRP